MGYKWDKTRKIQIGTFVFLSTLWLLSVSLCTYKYIQPKVSHSVYTYAQSWAPTEIIVGGHFAIHKTSPFG